jgi:hypothetical protein
MTGVICYSLQNGNLPPDLKERLWREEFKNPCYPYEPVYLREVYSSTGDQWMFHHYDARRDPANPTEYWISGEPSEVALMWSLRGANPPKELEDHGPTANNTPNPLVNRRPPVICSQAQLAQFLGYEKNYTRLIERRQADGTVERFVRISRCKFQVWLADPAAHQRALETMKRRKRRIS